MPPTKSVGTHMAADWSALLEELLAQVVGHLDAVADRVRFGAVSRSWRSASGGARLLAARGLPFLLLIDKTRCCLFDAGRQELCGTVVFPYFWRAARCRPPKEGGQDTAWTWFGTCHSWLGMASDQGDALLHNLFTGKRIRLASLGGGCEYEDRPRKLCMSFPDPSDPAGCVIMAICRWDRHPRYTRRGCRRWSEVEWRWWLAEAKDMVFHEGKFYVLCFPEGRRGVCVLAAVDVDVVGGDGRGNRDDPGPNKATFITEKALGDPDAIATVYLVGFPEGKLVVVVRKTVISGDGTVTTAGFELMKADVTGGRPPVLEAVVGGLGGRSIFVGCSCSTSISASEAAAAGYRGDSVYFTGDEYANDAGVFDARDGSVRQLYDADKLPMRLPWSMWVVPNASTRNP